MEQPRFAETLASHGIVLKREQLKTLQVNIGKRCNQACHHCHVESGPNRTENMTQATVQRLIELLSKAPSIDTVDITGGAPELNPHFRPFVSAIRAMGKQVIDRCNLTVLYEPGQTDTAEFLAEQEVQIVASLPCYMEDNVDAQRGKGVFDKSVAALRKLNALGYGQPDSGLELHLVYNPVGEHLPPPQASLAADYHNHLQTMFGIEFNQLFTITNMPIKRYAHWLARLGKLESYMQLLIDNFNPQAAQAVMCRDLISIGWDGQIYDCDFNQMLDIPLNGKPRDIWQIDDFSAIDSGVAVADHCYGCTAGSGSSCGGALL
ncbi:arsenosugar biosynthesis radical SAM (seleno)protein ArsS [Ostreibacterium oceani]|uniref:Radical SAM/Cys-rich domain protein n=1 Tax=Ostreibacterium oceani TaxID=2654998 RepID=A0A6N7ETN1_9GAMM|nr:arsenosugar biosynthesis radical SAM (seleno)protein ArsS [Ostreibacterium oceani]MPV85782.1 radical SAM/Cys-rich domain protein [Ostreibacterium oceani]